MDPDLKKFSFKSVHFDMQTIALLSYVVSQYLQ